MEQGSTRRPAALQGAARLQTQNQNNASKANQWEKTCGGVLTSRREAKLQGRSRAMGRSLYRQPHSSATMLGNLRTSSPWLDTLMMSWSE